MIAHEMAHFSGNDTTFSKKISPLLMKYDVYLHHLAQGITTVPVFHFMHCFRALFELSLGRLSRQREFRADRIAAELTSPQAVAASLLRITAYSKYRNSVETDLFESRTILNAANISEQISDGFDDFVTAFSTADDLGSLTTAHPFDSHPPLAKRLEAVGVPLSTESSRALLSGETDGAWFHNIDNAEELEAAQWDEYEQMFRETHERGLAYQYLPATVEESELVRRHFPTIVLSGAPGDLTLDCEGVNYESWPAPVEWASVQDCSMSDRGLDVVTNDGNGTFNIPLKKLKNTPESVEEFQRYYGRYLTAKHYIEEQSQ